MMPRRPASYTQAVPLNNQYILFSYPVLISTFDQPAPKWVCLDNKFEKPLIHPLSNHPSIQPSLGSFFFPFIYPNTHKSIQSMSLLTVYSLNRFIHPSHFICIIYQANPAIIYPFIPPFIFPLFTHFVHPSSVYTIHPSI